MVLCPRQSPTQSVAEQCDVLGELWVRRPAKNHDVPHGDVTVGCTLWIAATGGNVGWLAVGWKRERFVHKGRGKKRVSLVAFSGRWRSKTVKNWAAWWIEQTGVSSRRVKFSAPGERLCCSRPSFFFAEHATVSCSTA